VGDKNNNDQIGKIVFDNSLRDELSKLRPDQVAAVKLVGQLKMENLQLQRDLMRLKQQYDPLYQVMTAIAHASPGHEYVIHQSQFLRFKDEYRLKVWVGEADESLHIKLLTIHDEA
jgi:uncharacterized protein (DUF3084 family)